MKDGETKRDIRDTDRDQPALEAALAETWKTPAGLWGFLATVDHKIIGRRYIVTAFIFLALGGILAILMRVQLAQPEARLLGPDRYNQIFTMHGTNMMFLFAVPVMEAMAVYLVPLMVGTRNIAFPRLNAFSYWMFLAGGALLWIAFALDMGPDVGWFAYVPLSGPQYAAGKRADIWAQMITFTEVSALAVSVEIVVTIFKQRAPGMSLDRIPLFVWSMLVTSFLIIMAMPAIMIASTSLILDRLVGTHFFNPAEGGDVLLWQHLFWFFGHPEVYIVALPAFGIVSDLISTHARKNIFGYRMMVWAIVGIGALSFVVWAHHMYVSGMNPKFGFFFATTTLIIAVPTAIKVYNWILTLWRGDIHLTIPMLFALAFIITFVNGGLTGLFLGNVVVDVPLSDTMFVVAHFHMVMGVAPIMVVFGAIYHWYPKVTGRMLNEALGRFHFWVTFLGAYAVFFPMHYLGLLGMPRRYHDIGETAFVPASAHDLNAFMSVAALVVGFAQLVFVFNLIWSLSKGKEAGGNPWGATTLEWQTPETPPAHGNWGKELPVVYRWAYDYSVPGAKRDFVPQNEPPIRLAPQGAHP
ncbi:MAG: ctaD [Tardiphaga sp.]|nr:ctaD [Tardiphaga sp.]